MICQCKTTGHDPGCPLRIGSITTPTSCPPDSASIGHDENACDLAWEQHCQRHGKREAEVRAKLKAAELQIDELKKALYAECRGLACDSEGCYVGYRSCSGCEARAKKAYGEGWGK